jgi:bHLH-MYC and R2R3-MYB transcription factors N-terminal
MSFGEYSEKFSFEIGCGLPGRVYSSGVASWEQGIQNAPLQQFERSGGATQWGIQTVLGIPIPSPSAGRIVILFYSTEDRPRDLKLVNRITDLITKVRHCSCNYSFEKGNEMI